MPTSLRFLIWSYAESDNITPPGHCEGLDPGGDVHRVAREPLRLDDHLAHVDADANRNLLRAELPLDRNCGVHRGERAREHAHAAVPEPLDDRPAEGIVVALERTHVPVALVDSQALVGLQKRRVPDHVGEHHRDEPTVEPLGQDLARFRGARADGCSLIRARCRARNSRLPLMKSRRKRSSLSE